MSTIEIHTFQDLLSAISQTGFLPLLDSGVRGFSAEELADSDCRYVVLADGGWDWPLWKWKGPALADGNCVYGKFFNKKAGFIAREWWPDFYNYRRSRAPHPAPDSVEEAILAVLGEHGSMITRQLRSACGFVGAKMRSRFDASRPPQPRVRLGLGAAHHARGLAGQGSLPVRAHARRVAAAHAQPPAHHPPHSHRSPIAHPPGIITPMRVKPFNNNRVTE